MKCTRLNEGNGTAVACLESEAQMDEKHPNGTAPGRPEEPGPVNLDQAQHVLQRAKPVVGVGPGGLRPGHLTPLSK